MINYTNACHLHECGRGWGLLQQECQRYIFQSFLFFHFCQLRDKSMALTQSKNI